MITKKAVGQYFIKFFKIIFGFKIVRKILGIIIFMFICKVIIEYREVQNKKQAKYEAIEKEKRIEEEKVRYASLPLSEKIQTQVKFMMYGDFIKYENDILYLKRLLYCEDANEYGKLFGTAGGSVWLCSEECGGLMHDIYYLSDMFPQIKYVNYTFDAKARDEYGYSTIQKRGSFSVSIDKEQFSRYRTASDLKIHNSTMSACRNAQSKEIGDWIRITN